MQDTQTLARIRRKYQLLVPEMDERRRRQWAAAEARELGWGGVSLVARATGLSRPTITAGCGNWIYRRRSVRSRRHAHPPSAAAGGGR